MKENKIKTFRHIIAILISSILSALGLHIFVYSSNFAPSGVDGVATMLQQLTKLNAGIWLIIINLPLLIWAFFKLNKRYVVYTIVFTVISSALIYLLDYVDFYQYKSDTDRILPAIFAGIILGLRTGLLLKIGGSSGGVDILGFMIQAKKPHINIEKLISIICYVIIAASYFVYRDLTSILLSIIETFVLERTVSFVLKDSRNAVEVKIITKDPKILKEKILYELKHGATIIKCNGMYTGDDRFIVITIINMRQLGQIANIVKSIPDTFIYYTDVTGVTGNFRWKKDDLAK